MNAIQKLYEEDLFNLTYPKVRKQDSNYSVILNEFKQMLKSISGKVYLIDSNLQIIFTGSKIDNKNRTYLLNGEYMTQNKQKNKRRITSCTTSDQRHAE